MSADPTDQPEGFGPAVCVKCKHHQILHVLHNNGADHFCSATQEHVYDPVTGITMPSGPGRARCAERNHDGNCPHFKLANVIGLIESTMRGNIHD